MKRAKTPLALALLLSSLLLVAAGSGCVLEDGLSPRTTEAIPDDPRVAAVVERLQPSVVGIKATTSKGVLLQEIGLGTGVIMQTDGLVVTNNHVITRGGESGGNQPVDRIDVELPNGDTRRATVVGRFPPLDLAFLDIEEIDLVPAAFLTNLDEVQEGDFVVAIGKAPTLAQPVTVGQVAAILRNVRSPSLPGLTTLISSSAPLSQGNSGGPLADAQGRVIGINVAESLTQGGSGESRGGFSIPAPIVLDALKQVLERQ